MLNKTDFSSKYSANVGAAAKFKDNSTQEIEAVDMRDFSTDIWESVSFIIDEAYKRYTATASGTDTYTATLNPAITAYSSDHVYFIKFTNANTGTSTLNLNGLGAKTIKKNASTNLVAGDISAGQVLMLSYDGTNLQLIGSVNAGTNVLDIIDAGSVNIKPLVIQIGDWNMDSTNSVDVPHTLPDFKKIRSIQVTIRNDADALYYDLDQVFVGAPGGGHIGPIDSTNITVTRVSGGFFDSPTFDATSFNRGWITIWYEADPGPAGAADLKDGGVWLFASNSNNFPTSTYSGTLYIAGDAHGSPGDADYVPAGAWMISTVDGANEFSEYSIK